MHKPGCSEIFFSSSAEGKYRVTQIHSAAVSISFQGNIMFKAGTWDLFICWHHGPEHWHQKEVTLSPASISLHQRSANFGSLQLATVGWDKPWELPAVAIDRLMSAGLKRFSWTVNVPYNRNKELKAPEAKHQDLSSQLWIFKVRLSITLEIHRPMDNEQWKLFSYQKSIEVHKLTFMTVLRTELGKFRSKKQNLKTL